MFIWKNSAHGYHLHPLSNLTAPWRITLYVVLDAVWTSVTHLPVLEILTYHNTRAPNLRVNIQLIWKRKSASHATKLIGSVDKFWSVWDPQKIALNQQGQVIWKKVCKNEPLTLEFVFKEFDVTRTSLFFKLIRTENSWFNTWQNNAASKAANACL